MYARKPADYSLFIKAEPELLKDRLIERKLHGGKTQTWHLTADGDYELVERRED